MEGNIWFIIKLLPYLGFCSLIAGFIGWQLRGKTDHSPRAAADRESPSETQRLKKSQQALRLAENALQVAKQELAETKTALRKAGESEDLQEQLAQQKILLDNETRQQTVLRAELQKAQEQLNGFHARSQNDSKEQRERVFVLENELSQARAELSQLRGATDESGALREELERARESVSQATRFAGEMRKREAALQAELESMRSLASTATRPVMSLPVAPVTPVGDSDAVLRARAEVAAIEAKRALIKEESASDE